MNAVLSAKNPKAGKHTRQPSQGLRGGTEGQSWGIAARQPVSTWRDRWPDHRGGIDWGSLVESLTDNKEIVAAARDLSISAKWLLFSAAPGWRLVRVGEVELIESRHVRGWLIGNGLATFLRNGRIAWLHAPDGSPLAGQPDDESAAA